MWLRIKWRGLFTELLCQSSVVALFLMKIYIIGTFEKQLCPYLGPRLLLRFFPSHKSKYPSVHLMNKILYYLTKDGQHNTVSLSFMKDCIRSFPILVSTEKERAITFSRLNIIHVLNEPIPHYFWCVFQLECITLLLILAGLTPNSVFMALLICIPPCWIFRTHFCAQL